MNLNARDIVDDKQFAPFLMDGQTIRQQAQVVLKKPGTPVSLRRGQPVSIAVKWTGTGIPESRNVLRRVAEHSTALEDGIDGRYYEGIIVIIRFYPAKQDVAVNQVWRACHLAAALVKAFAREALGRQIRQFFGARCKRFEHRMELV